MAAHETDTPELSQASGASRAAGNIAALGWPLFMLLISGVLWGLFYSLNRFATTGGIPFLAYVFWMGAGASILLFLLGLATRSLPSLQWAHLRAYLVLGTISFGLSYTVLAIAAPEVPAGVLSLGATLTPILTYPAAALFKLDRFAALRTLGLLCGLGAVVLIVVPKTSLPSPDMVIWVLVSFITPLCYGMANVLIAIMRPPESTSLSLASAILLTGAVIMCVVMVATGGWWWFDGTMSGGDWALIAVVLINAVFFWLLLEIIRLAGPVFFSVQNYIATLSGIAWGMLIHSEAHSIWIWLALVLLFMGLALVIRGSLKTEASN